MHYSIRIENASPLILNGLAALGTASSPDETPKVLLGIAYRRAEASPCRRAKKPSRPSDSRRGSS